MTDTADPLRRLGPAILGAGGFACADVLAKVALNAGADVLTTATSRGVFAVLLLYAWLKVGTPPRAITPRARRISIALGVVFTANLLLLFKAFELIEVPVAIQTYFVYPLLTGLIAAVTGVEALTMRGFAAAVVAFTGLAVMIGAHPGGLAGLGVLAALAAACCRVIILLISRASLQDTDARLITWYTLSASTLLLAACSLAAWNWQPPATLLGWLALVGLAVFTTVGILAVYVSTARIGPFRTALFMNLEPLLTAVGSAIILDEVLTPLQLLGGALMLAALVAFQLRR
jgi:drug/metabolite transporter (DMT)-like permease